MDELKIYTLDLSLTYSCSTFPSQSHAGTVWKRLKISYLPPPDSPIILVFYRPNRFTKFGRVHLLTEFEIQGENRAYTCGQLAVYQK